jgi:hypothetical protein
MDTTYYWRNYWIMVFRWRPLRRNLYRKEVPRETKEYYLEWIEKLKNDWREIIGIVCDWKRWLLWWFDWIPTQMCHFHQKQIITRYITKKPILEENIELKDIASFVWKLRKDILKQWLDSWKERNAVFFKEKNENGWFKHLRTRSAYKSLAHNLPYLYTYKAIEYMPNTTNSLEWTFAHLKEKVRLHRWLKKRRKRKLIDDYLSKK